MAVGQKERVHWQDEIIYVKCSTQCSVSFSVQGAIPSAETGKGNTIHARAVAVQLDQLLVAGRSVKVAQ